MSKLIMVLTMAGVLAVSLTCGVPSSMADEVKRIDPSKEKSLKSPEDGEEVTLTIKNTRKSAITWYWIDYQGDRVHYKDFEAGEEVEQITFPGHYWIVVDSKGKALGIYKTPDKDATITVTADELPRIDPQKEKDFPSSPKDGAAIDLLIRNHTNGALKLYWIDENGDRVLYHTIKAGKEVKQGSYDGHTWIVLDKDSKALGIYRCTAKDGTITVAAPDDNELPRIDPSKEKGLKSPEDGEEVTLTIKNGRKSTISTYWIDYEGDRVQYQDVEAGKEAKQITFPGHYWVVVDSKGKALGIYKTPAKDGVIRIK